MATILAKVIGGGAGHICTAVGAIASSTGGYAAATWNDIPVEFDRTYKSPEQFHAERAAKRAARMAGAAALANVVETTNDAKAVTLPRMKTKAAA